MGDGDATKNGDLKIDKCAINLQIHQLPSFFLKNSTTSIAGRTNSSGNAYAYINIDKPGTLIVTATQGKTAADNSNCQLAIYTGAGPKDGGTIYSEKIELEPYDTAAANNGAVAYEFEFAEVTELTKVAITKPGGATSPDIYKIEWYAK